MKAGGLLAALAALSFGLDAARYRDAGDLDARAAEAFAARLASADLLVARVEEHPAFRALHLRRPGCPAAFRLAFAPDDGGADAALARLMPDAAVFVAPDDGWGRPGWRVAAEARRGARCADLDALRAALGVRT